VLPGRAHYGTAELIRWQRARAITDADPGIRQFADRWHLR
jgi:hypothetical protein